MKAKVIDKHSRHWVNGDVEFQQDLERQAEKGEKQNAAYSNAFDKPIFGKVISTGETLVDRLSDYNRFLGRSD